MPVSSPGNARCGGIPNAEDSLGRSFGILYGRGPSAKTRPAGGRAAPGGRSHPACSLGLDQRECSVALLGLTQVEEDLVEDDVVQDSDAAPSEGLGESSRIRAARLDMRAQASASQALQH